MLDRVLKLFGFDLDARIEALKAEVEQRLAEVTHEVQRIARTTAMTAGFAFAGIVTALLAVLVGLIALYVWVADQHGVYAGLGVVGGLLVVLTVVLMLAARGSARAIGGKPDRKELPHKPPEMPRTLPAPAAGSNEGATVRSAAISPLAEQALAASAHPRPASAADLAEPLAALLTGVLGGPRSGNILLDQVLTHAQIAATGSTGEVVDKATTLVRDGDRATMLGVLGAAGVVGYLLGDALASRRAPFR